MAKHCQNCNESHVKMNIPFSICGGCAPQTPCCGDCEPPISFFWIHHCALTETRLDLQLDSACSAECQQLQCSVTACSTESACSACTVYVFFGTLVIHCVISSLQKELKVMTRIYGERKKTLYM